MTLLAPGFLWLALLAPAALWLRRRRGAPAVLFAPATAGLPKPWRVRLLWLPPLLQSSGLLLAVYALARPVNQVPLPVTSEGIDIMLCLDTSSSMSARDMDSRRTRLDLARDAATAFVQGRPDDRIGLVAFARFPDLRCPPTLDHEALGQLLADVAPVRGDGPEDATGIGTATARAVEVLKGSEAKSKVVIVLTDGEENVATATKPEEIAPLHAGQLAARFGIRVYTVSVGLGGRNRAGDWVAIDTTQIRKLAERTGGRFFEARDAGAVGGVYTEITGLERITFEEPRFQAVEEFLPYLWAAVAALVAGRVLRSSLLRVRP